MTRAKFLKTTNSDVKTKVFFLSLLCFGQCTDAQYQYDNNKQQCLYKSLKGIDIMKCQGINLIIKKKK